MNYEQMTLKLQDALQEAASLARQKDHAEITNLHLLYAFLSQEEGIILPLFERIGVKPSSVLKDIESALKKYPLVKGMTNIGLSSSLEKAFSMAEKEMDFFKDRYLSVEHVFLAMLDCTDDAAEILKKKGIERKNILEALKSVRGNQTIDSQDPESKMRDLEKYCIDLTARARLYKIDPVIGRDDEIRRVMQVLCRRTKNNPVLVGEPGVGKTAIVEGLAKRIASSAVPSKILFSFKICFNDLL